ncbi:hypothetical protein NLI96_g8052 [Meripilus lineatus]|uniref:Uncharacterized protein n=1 Tax=Meripilus lineatus TaxID=2056292 RepID=A0AAD5YGK5_9APHY|nr:hypothetical protein NLI96_g8052 [Physisporinus lineatus]
MVPPTLDIHQHPALVESTSGDSESYSSDPDSPPPASPPSIVLTSFSHGCKPDLRLITSAYSPPSPGSKSSSPSISSEPPTPATQSGCSTESELLTPLSSQQDISPVFTSSASFTVPLYSHSASPHSSALPQSFRQSPVQPGSTPVTPTTLSPKRLCPEPSFRFPSVAPAVAPISRSRPGSTHPDPTSGSNLAPRVKISHPYARLYAKNSKEAGAAKRRRMWNHALEKSFFTPQELSTMGAPQRRTIYTASLEAHVDRLHKQLEECQLFPVMPQQLEPYRGLNSKTAKSMVAGLQKDMSDMKLKALELERSVRGIE